MRRYLLRRRDICAGYRYRRGNKFCEDDSKAEFPPPRVDDEGCEWLEDWMCEG